MNNHDEYLYASTCSRSILTIKPTCNSMNLVAHHKCNFSYLHGEAFQHRGFLYCFDVIDSQPDQQVHDYDWHEDEEEDEEDVSHNIVKYPLVKHLLSFGTAGKYWIILKLPNHHNWCLQQRELRQAESVLEWYWNKTVNINMLLIRNVVWHVYIPQ